MDIKWNTKAVLYGIIAIILVVGGFLVAPKFFGDKAEAVEFTVVERDSIPDKILDIMPKYVNEERALACKIKDKVYVIVTRGENKDYGVAIEKIEMVKEDDKMNMKVYSVYKKPEDSHPYIVVESSLSDLPDKVELISRFEDK